MQSVSWFFENADKIAGIIVSAVTIARLIVALTPTPADDAIMARFFPLLEGLAGLLSGTKSLSSAPRKEQANEPPDQLH